MTIRVDFSRTLADLKETMRSADKKIQRAVKVNLLEYTDALKAYVGSGRSRGRAYRRGGVVHYASTPGNPPNKDTGFLQWSIRPSKRLKNGVGFVGVFAKYGRALEFGRRGMAPRPFVRPTIDSRRRRFRLRIMRAVNSAS